jgi:hypothetical protein
MYLRLTHDVLSFASISLSVPCTHRDVSLNLTVLQIQLTVVVLGQVVILLCLDFSVSELV